MKGKAELRIEKKEENIIYVQDENSIHKHKQLYLNELINSHYKNPP